MPRTARKKSSNSIYHIMCRSISEVDLFRSSEDKEKYLKYLKQYKDMLMFKVYSYCIMDNHCHFIIDTNGADISTIFHGINFKYAIYFNKKYNRNGHLFQDRFKSKIVDSMRYLITLSGYIHANPLSIKKYRNRVEEYEYSSLGIYLGIKEDKLSLVEKDFIMSNFANSEVSAEKLYLEYVKTCTDAKIESEIEFKNEGTNYVSERKILFRDYSIEKIIEFLKEKIKATEVTLKMKNCRKTVEQRAIFALFMRCFCNYRVKDICSIIGNITQSRVSSLCAKGVELIQNNEKYSKLINEFLEECAV